MAGQGLQFIPLARSIPTQWDAAWFAKFVREVLAQADVRNALEGPGISISGQSGEPATISASADVQNLLLQSYVTATASGFLPNERVLAGENGVVSITDNGADSTIAVGLYDGGVPYTKLNDIDELSVLGNPTDAFGPLSRISGTAQHEVLSIQLNGSDLEARFGTITHESVSDFVPTVLSTVLPLLPFNRGATFTAGNTAIALPVANVPITIPINCTIRRVTLLTIGGTGSCVVDIFKSAYSGYPPSSSICASAKPTIVGGIKYQDATLTGWTTAITAGDCLTFSLASSSTFTSIVVLLELIPVP